MPARKHRCLRDCWGRVASALFCAKCEVSPDCECCGQSAWCVLDKWGSICTAVAISAIVLTNWTIVRVIIIPWYGLNTSGTVMAVTISFLCAMALVCHLRCMLTCPGVQKRHTVSNEEYKKYLANSHFYGNSLRICRKCRAYKSNGAHHCRQCDRCVLRMDHHCPWVNNCVGRYNQKYFVLFLLYVVLGETYSITIFFARAVSCLLHPEMCVDPIPPIGFVVAPVMAVISVFFLIFVITMASDQYAAIDDELTYIDRLQHRAPRGDRSFHEALEDIFGDAFSIRWFLPVACGTIIPHDSYPE